MHPQQANQRKRTVLLASRLPSRTKLCAKFPSGRKLERPDVERLLSERLSEPELLNRKLKYASGGQES